MDFFQSIFGSHTTILVLCCVVIFQTFSLFVLGYVLINRERTLQLAQFAISPTGVKFIYEIDRDKKVEFLVAENILLRKEIEVLKADKTRLRLTTLVIILAVYLVFIAWKFRELFKVTSSDILPTPKEAQEMVEKKMADNSLK